MVLNARMLEKTSCADDVETSLRQLVDHYSQTVHFSYDDKSLQSPYFDRLLGHAPTISAVTQVHLEKLGALPRSSIWQWIIGYTSFIRPIASKTSLGYVSVLQQFELLLAIWRKDLENDEPYFACTTDSIDKKTLSDLLVTLASDLTLFSSQKLFELSTPIRCNLLLPLLLRVLFHLLQMSLLIPIQPEESALRRCLVSLLAWDCISYDPASVAPSLQGSNSENICDPSSCVLPPARTLWKEDQRAALRSMLTLESIDWSSAAFEDARLWNDPVTGIASRVVGSVWKVLAAVTLRKHSDLRSGPVGIPTTSCSSVSALKLWLIHHSSICSRHSAQAVQDHFFGRDISHLEPQTIDIQRTFLGRRISEVQPMSAEKPYQIVPSRVNVFLGWVCHLPSNSERAVEQVNSLLPICLELLDTVSHIHVTMGASALNHLLHAFPTQTEVWEGWSAEVFSHLGLAFQVHREKHVLLAVGQAQTKLLAIIQNGLKQRRRITRDWLTLLRHVSARPNLEVTCWELLVGGVTPLLYQHAQLSNGDGMELGRLGLAALLPLVAGEFSDEKTQVASMIALINLMAAAYPIMPHHGEKILCHLLGAMTLWKVGDTTREHFILRETAVHTAAAAFLVCGQKRTKLIIDSFRNDESNYDDVAETFINEAMERSSFMAGFV